MPLTTGFGLGGVKSPPGPPFSGGERGLVVPGWRDANEVKLGLLESK